MNGENSGELNKFDPDERKRVEGAVEPGYLYGLGGENNRSGNFDNRQSTGADDASGGFYRGANARDELNSREERAGDSVSKVDGSNLDSVKENEEEAGGFKSSVKGRETNRGKKKAKGEGKGFFSRRGAASWSIFAIFAFTITITMMMAPSSILNPLVSWKENVVAKYGHSSAIMRRRSKVIMKQMLSTDNGTSRYKISEKLAKKLKAQNIHYVEETDADGNEIRMLVFEESDGTTRSIVASDSDVAKANALSGREIDVGDGKILKLTNSSTTLKNAIDTDVNFTARFDAATITFTGKIAGWFDNVTEILLRRIIGKDARGQLKKNMTEEEVDDEIRSNVSDGADKSKMQIDEEGDNGKLVEIGKDEVLVDNGETYGEIAARADNVEVGVTEREASAKLSSKAAKVAAMSANVACGFLRAIGAISTTLSAIQTSNIISYASKYLEAADQIKAGDGNETTNAMINNANKSVKSVVYDKDGNKVEPEPEGSVIGSTGFNAAFAKGNIVDKNDPTALMVNREYTLKNAMSAANAGILGDVGEAVLGLGASAVAFKTCMNIQFATGMAGGVIDIVLLFTTAGIGNAIKSMFKGIGKALIVAGVITAAMVVVTAVAPMVASWLGEKIQSLEGLVGGHSMTSGAGEILGKQTVMSTGIYATEETALAVELARREEEEEWARYERTTMSPFDASSQYTFLGSIVNSFMPIMNMANGSNAIASTVSSVAKLTGDSAIALISDTASAVEEGSYYAQSIADPDDCSSLAVVDVVGDVAYCQPLSGAIMEDVDNVNADENYQKMKDYGSFSGEDSNGNPTINNDSNYAKFIISCVTSDVPPGTMDGAVAGYIEKGIQAVSGGSAIGGALINFGMNFVPFEDFLDAIDAGEQMNNYKWNSKEACTAQTDDPNVNEMVRTFSTFTLDQRVLADAEVIDKNPVVAFLEEYYEENPLDQSLEGKIARFSGMTKEQVSDTLALIEYYNYVAKYNPEERYAFGEEMVKQVEKIYFDNDNLMARNVYMVMPEAIIYADVRNRNFVA